MPLFSALVENGCAQEAQLLVFDSGAMKSIQKDALQCVVEEECPIVSCREAHGSVMGQIILTPVQKLDKDKLDVAWPPR